MDVPGIALITGAASGIGRACALGFAQEGCAGLALFDLNADALVSVKAEVEAVSKRDAFKVLTFTVDVSDEEQVETLISEAAIGLGRIDYLVNAAGIVMKHPGGTSTVKTDDWKRVLDINLSGSFYVLRAASRIMIQQDPLPSSLEGRLPQRGSIVNFSSIHAAVGFPFSTAYAAAKNGIIGLTRTASEEYAKDGLRVNSICPGYTETPMTTQNPEVLKAMQERVQTSIPMARMGNPYEIADSVLYLAGGRSSFVTGISLMVDGGYTSR